MQFFLPFCHQNLEINSYFALKQNQEVKDDYEDEKPDLAKLVAQTTNSFRLKFNAESPRVQTVPFVKLDHSVSPGMVQSWKFLLITFKTRNSVIFYSLPRISYSRITLSQWWAFMSGWRKAFQSWIHSKATKRYDDMDTVTGKAPKWILLPSNYTLVVWPTRRPGKQELSHV